MIRTLLWLVALSVLFYACSAFPIGKAKTADGWPWGAEGRETVLGHVRAIWHSEQVQDLKDGVEEKAGPAASDLKKKIHDATSDSVDAGVPDAAR